MPVISPSAHVLPHPLLNLLQRRAQVFQRVGDAEAEIAFSVFAESGAGEAGYTGLFEQRIGQFLRRPSGLSDVREDVERAFGDTAGCPVLASRFSALGWVVDFSSVLAVGQIQ